ncbi:fatty acid metabolism transcriptional regulator FadR [Histophilus somni]|uniref:Fatty acid metabolism regulator protein n=1 Tax=Histophilus somni TaxID=731 RepID=A0AAX2RXK1_HISSO|nr:fatty acid metabolism transcriptional regulator FadR [Histophilus somni]MBB5151639.1 GntR family negative regulator for fad regulon and positive regulator of fabA [Histophilus somni]QEH08527.1 fatty acid metabolism transcriptional regulator FadR [Histophilus somni]QEH12890.1 fatty acid metabolism transcriptional regulator FadR [Histophilus somni]QEH17600.1 fatty acid metabolism transcriptional regulator FadR [Histophilus somni]QEH21210.1 fatty acid metabolism transcriptional regulator FadR 
MDILKAQSPAALAEEYIVKSIWNNHFPAGSDLPAERELADKIGVTRTTLREVLQRLNRDGWLNIQHGKPTKVNNIWETAGPNILKTLIQLSPTLKPTVIANVVSLRTRMGEQFIPEAIKINPQQTFEFFQSLDELDDDEKSYAEFDYNLYHRFSFISDKPVYTLILNSFRTLYHQVAALFFINPQSRQVELTFYQQLKECCRNGDYQQASVYLVENRERSSAIWKGILTNLPENFCEEG